MSVDATPSRPRSTRPLADDDPLDLRRRSPVGKIVAVAVVLVLLGGAGFFGWTRYQATVAKVKRTRADLAQARSKGRDAERRERETKATLAGQEAELAELRSLRAEVAPTRLPAAEAATILAKLREALGTSGEAASAGGRVTLVLGEAALFEGGKAEVTEEGEELLGKLGKALDALPGTQLWIQGHTGNRRPRDKRSFPSNWELSTARALAVLHWLEDEADVDGDRLAVVGLGQHRPMGADRSARIEIVVFPKEPPAPVATAAPGSGAPSAPRRAPVRRPAPRRSDSGLGPL